MTDKDTARAAGKDLPISIKQSIEVCNSLRNKPVARAKRILEDAISLRRAIPFTRFMNGLGHKPGIGAGRYAVKTCMETLKILNAAIANAENKGISGDLHILHISAQRGSTQYHYGRQRRAKMKRTHLEIIVGEHPKQKEATA
ncbi:MAG: 50S ribosomal protein L22 [archaeon]